MKLKYQIILITSFLVSFVSGQRVKDYEIYNEWEQIDYNFPNDAVRNESLQSGRFTPITCVPTGIRVYGDIMFVATPRYYPGVPSTLNVIPYRKPKVDQYFRRNTGPKLTPFPNWEMQEEGNCFALQLVQTMELDSYNRLWILDVGRTEVLTGTPKNLCPAKLVIYDLVAKKIDRVYEFPNNVVPFNSNLVKDFQVACTSRVDCHSYISNLNPTCAIVVYDYKNNDSWYATHSSMQPDMSKANVTIDGTPSTVPFGITGLGLTPRFTGFSTVFFSKLAGDHVYSLRTSFLKDSSKLKQNPVLEDGVIRDLGMKPMGQADGTIMDNRGRWYFGSLPESAVYSIDTNGDPMTLPKTVKEVQSLRDMQWPDAFSFDGKGYLLFTAPRFQRVAANIINPKEVNFRIIRFKTNSLPYFEPK